MATSYLERAQIWLNSEEDIEIKSVESTIFKFSEEIRKNSNYSTQNETKIKDLKETISYLKNWIRTSTESVSTLDKYYKESISTATQYDLDPSSLVDHTIQPKIISREEKLLSIIQIKNSPNFISASELIKKK